MVPVSLREDIPFGPRNSRPLDAHQPPSPGPIRRLTFSAWRYILPPVIKSVRDRETARIFARERSTRFPPDLQQLAYRKLRMLHNAQSLADLRLPPGNRLEKLSGGRAGRHSIRINQRWRICFEWRGGDAHDVEIVDYH